MSDTTIDADDLNDNNKWWVLFAVCVATFMLLLDVTIVNVALPDIQRTLHSSFSDLQWVVDAYALTLAAFLLTWGSLADLFGRRRMFVLGIVIFTAASLTCALAVNPFMLNSSRGVQGVGAAAMFATALALLAQEFRGKERGIAFGVWGATTGAAVAIGPLVGGVLTDSFGWESIFYVNVPVGLAAIALTFAKVTDSHQRGPHTKIDWIGLPTFAISLFLLIYGLVRGNIEGWSSGKIVGSFAVAAILMIIFIVAEATQEHAMFDLTLFKNPTFDGAAIAAFVLSASIFALFLYITLYFQNFLGYSPFESGLRALPATVGSFFFAAIAGRLSSHLPLRGFFLVGLGFVAAGLLTMTQVEPTSHWTVLLPGLILTGIGIGITNPPLASAAVGVVEARKSGMASGINSTFRQLGIATGIAGLGAIFQHDIIRRVTDRLSATSELTSAQVNTVAHSVTEGTVNQVIAGLPEQTRNVATSAVRSAFVNSFDRITLIAGTLAVIGALASAALVRTKDFAHGSGQAADRH